MDLCFYWAKAVSDKFFSLPLKVLYHLLLFKGIVGNSPSYAFHRSPLRTLTLASLVWLSLSSELRLFSPILLCYLCPYHFFISKLYLSIKVRSVKTLIHAFFSSYHSEVSSSISVLSEHKVISVLLAIITFYL